MQQKCMHNAKVLVNAKQVIDRADRNVQIDLIQFKFIIWTYIQNSDFCSRSCDKKIDEQTILPKSFELQYERIACQAHFYKEYVSSSCKYWLALSHILDDYL